MYTKEYVVSTSKWVIVDECEDVISPEMEEFEADILLSHLNRGM